jgi:tight adherence protein C
MHKRRPEPKRAGWWLVGWLVLLGLALASPPVALAAPPAVLETEALVDSFPTTVLQMSIQDETGRAINGLTAEDFSLVENGKAIQPTSTSQVRQSEEPISLMVALDTSLSMADDGRLEKAREAAKAVANRLRPTDNIALVRFDTAFGMAQPFTRDRVVFAQTLDRLQADGNRKFYDGAYLAVSETARIAGNRAVILIVNGDDSGSHVTLGTVKNLIADTGVKVYVIGVGPELREEVLESLAKGSNGRYYRAPTGADLPSVVNAAAEDFGNRYEVVYSSQALDVEPGTRVVTQVTVAAPGGLTTTSIAYRAPRAVGATTAPAPRRQAPLQVIPPRPAPAPLPDQMIVNAGILTGLGIVLATLGVIINRRRVSYDRRLRTFIRASDSRADEDRAPSMLGLALGYLLRGIAYVLIRLLPPHQVRQISRRLVLAGSPNGWRVSHFLALKGLLALIMLFVGWLIPPSSVVLAVVLPVLFGLIGYVAPDVWLSNRVRTRKRLILRALPNALDLLAISVEAGLSLDAAMLEVVHKWRDPLTEELSNVLADLKVGRSRRDSLRGLAQRTDIPEVATFVSALVQADEVGLSIGRTLAVQAEQIRLRQRQRAERLAREASIKMLFPMAFLIFPAIFVVILVPALPTLVNSLRSLGG